MSAVTHRQRRLRKRYIRVVKVGTRWETLFNPSGNYGQTFTVIRDATKPEADYFARMLVKGLERLLQIEVKEGKL